MNKSPNSDLILSISLFKSFTFSCNALTSSVRLPFLARSIIFSTRYFCSSNTIIFSLSSFSFAGVIPLLSANGDLGFGFSTRGMDCSGKRLVWRNWIAAALIDDCTRLSVSVGAGDCKMRFDCASYWVNRSTNRDRILWASSNSAFDGSCVCLPSISSIEGVL